MPSPVSDAKLVPALLALGMCLGIGACNHGKAHAVPPVTTPPAAPVENKPPATAPTPPKIDAQPAPAPLPETTTPNVPKPKPKKPATDQSSESNSDQSSHPTAPQISPQMSPGDQATLEKKTAEDIAAAQANLAQSKNKPLSAAQQDLVDKIRSFLDEAGEASKSGDWARAQNLAQKAHLLSNELVNSL
jgi:outer membrane biosynthesis protein TonB